jgi:hypothetical protein
VNGAWLNPSWTIQVPSSLFHPTFELNQKPSASARCSSKVRAWATDEATFTEGGRLETCR